MMCDDAVAQAGEGSERWKWNGGEAPLRGPPFMLVSMKRWMRKSVLRRAVGAHQPRLADRALAAGGAQAGRLEIRPRLLGAVAADRANIEPVGFGERLRHAGFDLRCKSGKNGEAGGDEGSDGDRRERFDH